MVRWTLPVALRKESVDRNGVGVLRVAAGSGSLSARRAWIEIGRTSTTAKRFWRSLSARRAWIEMRGNRRGKCVCCRRSPQGERG